jgi:hypothetical protein
MNLSWNAIDGIMQRAVVRGLARREDVFATQLGVDETAPGDCVEPLIGSNLSPTFLALASI